MHDLMSYKAIKAACILVVLVSGAWSQPSDQARTPERIMLNLTVSPATSMAVTWRTEEAVDLSRVEFAVATDGPEFAKSTSSTPAHAESVELNTGKTAVYHSAVIDGLLPNTVYAYRVGDDKRWSSWNQFRTADTSRTPFTFVFFGDPQTDIRAHVARSFREAYKHASNARFWLFAGDLTTTPTDEMWEEWFDASGFIFATMPAIMVPGNHDYGTVMMAARNERSSKLPFWRPQFTLPENGIPGLPETSYVIDYQGVRFVMIDSNTKLNEQAAWMDSVLSVHPARWTIVSFHHPLYSTGGTRDNRTTRDAFLAVFDKHHVDLVLQGHDHTYGRTHKLRGDGVVGEKEAGTVYVTSSSGPKMYDLNDRYRELMAKMGERKQLYQVITIDGNTLRFEAVTASGTPFDSFVLEK